MARHGSSVQIERMDAVREENISENTETAFTSDAKKVLDMHSLGIHCFRSSGMPFPTPTTGVWLYPHKKPHPTN